MSDALVDPGSLPPTHRAHPEWARREGFTFIGDWAGPMYATRRGWPISVDDGGVKAMDVDPETLARSRRQAMDNGVRYAYTGNVHDPVGDTTYCHVCDAPLIRRDWYDLGAWNLDKKGNCPGCGTTLAGRFERTPGSWGAFSSRPASSRISILR